MADLRDRLQTSLGPAYQVQKELGGGGMSRVFVAQEVRFSRSVVVKVLPPEFGAGVNTERFEREIALAAKLQHPHIVPLLTAGSDGDLLYYIMPHIEGRSLGARLREQRELTLGETLRVLRDVCDALAYAHAQHIVHRDIKPDNILLSGKHALVTDFGVAKAVQASTGTTALTSVGLALGTPAYMAPEQAAGDPNTDHRADIYAVGALAYEALTGRIPFTGPSVQAILAAKLTHQPDPITKHTAGVPAPVAELLMRCLAKDPADRPQSANEILEQFDHIGATLTASRAAATAVPHPRPLVLAGGFILGSAGVIAAVYLLRQLLGLPDWVLPAAEVLLGVGLPIVMATGVLERRRALAQRPPSAGWLSMLTWRKAITGGVLAFAALGAGVAIYEAMRALGIGPVGTLVASGVLGERDRLVLADFENRTRDSTLGPSVGEAFRIDLAQSPTIRLLDGAAIAGALQRMQQPAGTRLDLRLARELAQREGAKGVVHGQIDPVGRGYVLAAEVVAAADGSVLVALRENAKDDGEIIEAVDRLSKRLRERIGESLKTIRASEPLERVTTASIPALRRYSQAIVADNNGDTDRGIVLLNEAIALDTAFAMAYRKLAVFRSNSGAARSQIGAAATSAFRHRERLPPAERNLAIAYYYSQVEVDRTKTEEAYRAALELNPDDYVAANNLALLYNAMRRYAQADSVASPFLGGPNYAIYLNVTSARIGQGNFEAAAAAVRAFEQSSPRNPRITFLQSLLAVNQGKYDSAEAYVRARVEGDLFSQSVQAFQLYSLAELRGRLKVADQEVRRFLDLTERRQVAGLYLNGAVNLARMQLRFLDARAAAIHTVDAALARFPLARLAVEDRPYTALAWFYAEVGQPERARRLMTEYEAAVPEGLRRADASRYAVAANIALAEGRLNDALQGYRAFYDSADCGPCGLFEIGQVYDRLGQADSAVALYERAVNTPAFGRLFVDAPSLALAYRRLGELYEQRGDRAKAREYYGKFVDLWSGADPELQGSVRDVRSRLQRLAAEQ
ncbi:MAG: protein kinase domain-containing protein [Gemmatimonadota bacterium]